MINARMQIFPQMEYYDRMPSGSPVPFAMLAGPRSFQSDKINTDRNGFRSSIFGDKRVDSTNLENYDCVNFLIGGSTVFGVGCLDDQHTIASILSQKSKQPWVNLGIRGSVSLQEIIHLFQLIHKAKKIGNIVFFSGVNDVYANFLYSDKNAYDRYFNEIKLELVSKSLKRQIFCHLFAKIHSCGPEDLASLTLREMIFYKKINDLLEGCPLDKIVEIIYRNFLIYSGLKSVAKEEVAFVLQPFFYWTNKTHSPDEKAVFDYLDEIQADSKWLEIKKRMMDHNTYRTITAAYESASRKNGILYFDSNKEFNHEETLFVDSVHLNDRANELASEVIIKNCNIKRG